jgi:hypothetical protein
MKESTKSSKEYITDAVRRNAKKIKQTLTVIQRTIFTPTNYKQIVVDTISLA